MKAYQLKPGHKYATLALAESERPALTGRQVRVRVHAVSLNFRDLMVADGNYLGTHDTPLVPCSDGAGEVIELGPEVTRFRLGDRVAASFFPNWIDGVATGQKTGAALGGSVDGMLAEEVVASEDGLVAIPAHLSYAEAATQPCAGVTAWNALFATGGLKAGDSVLLLGTGGVSIWGLQIAQAAGLRSIITSSSDEKLGRARRLGATATINYRHTPEWQDEVMRLTGGQGVDLVLEVGGQGTLARSITSASMGGRIAVIGGVSGFGGEVNPFALIGGSKHLSGIHVGSRTMFENLNRLVAAREIRPVVDATFPFAQAKEAYRHLESGSHFGKVVIDVTA